jgi:hypothetical protein
MNAVEIADAVADLAAAPFDATEFPYQFLKAFDKKETQLKRLKKGDTNLGLLEGVRRFVLHVRELSVDLIDSINPLGEAYAVLARMQNADTLRQMQEKIAAKKVSIPEDEALALARRALEWKQERGRTPQIFSSGKMAHPIHDSNPTPIVFAKHTLFLVHR